MFDFKDGEVLEVRWVGIEDLKENIIQNPNKYVNRLFAIELLKFYIG